MQVTSEHSSVRAPRLFEYRNAAHFLRDSFKFKQSQNPLFSVRSWAQQMGFRSHSSLVLLLNEKRRIRPEHIEFLKKGLRLAGDEEKYFRLLVDWSEAKSEALRAELADRLRVLEPTLTEASLETERFALVADWIHMAILEMTQLRDFESTATWIQSRLRFPMSVEIVEQGINRLLQLGLLKWEDGRLRKTRARLTTPKDRASEAIREYHRQVMANGIAAIEAQTVDERVLNSCAMTIHTSRISEAKELILKFRSDMAKLMEDAAGDETYQLSVQFYKLTGPVEKEL